MRCSVRSLVSPFPSTTRSEPVESPAAAQELARAPPPATSIGTVTWHGCRRLRCWMTLRMPPPRRSRAGRYTQSIAVAPELVGSATIFGAKLKSIPPTSLVGRSALPFDFGHQFPTPNPMPGCLSVHGRATGSVVRAGRSWSSCDRPRHCTGLTLCPPGERVEHLAVLPGDHLQAAGDAMMRIACRTMSSRSPELSSRYHWPSGPIS